FGKVALETDRAGTVLWAPRGGDHPRRRHEITFQVKAACGLAGGGSQSRKRPDEEVSLTFVSRPGVFTYGRMDDGARALTEVADVRPGDQVLDLGCGTGTVGVIAGLRAGAGGSVTFVDSNVRAATLTEINARANGLPDFRVVADAKLDDLPPRHFDVVLANPPYYAQQGVARLFVDAARRVLKPGGRVYVVTKQADVVGAMLAEQVAEPVAVTRRDYAVLMAK